MRGKPRSPETVSGAPHLVPGEYLQAVIRGPRGGWERHPVLVVAAREDGLELEAALRQLPPALRPGTPLRCTLPRDHEILTWPATVLAVVSASTGRFLASWPEAHHRVQRRGYARVDLSLPVTFEPAGGGDAEPATGVTTDLGGGGLGLTTSTPLEPGRKLRVTLQLEPGQGVEAEARVVSLIRPPAPGVPGQYGLEFTAITEQARDVIFRRIFLEQARQRRLGLLPRGGRRG